MKTIEQIKKELRDKFSQYSEIDYHMESIEDFIEQQITELLDGMQKEISKEERIADDDETRYFNLGRDSVKLKIIECRNIIINTKE